MKIKVIYRNYIPLYSGYSSFWEIKIKDVDFVVPRSNKNLKWIFNVYRKIKFIPVFDWLFKTFKGMFFNENIKGYDYLFYCGLAPRRIPNIPFMLDFEHVLALLDFASVNKRDINDLWQILNHDNCRHLLPWSKAAAKTLERMYPKKYRKISHKVKVLYPAFSYYKKKYKVDYGFVKNDSKIKILFVANDYKLKGLLELLEALERLNNTYDFEFHCVTNYDDEILKKYHSKNYHFYKANFKHQDLVQKFFRTCDFFVMPTHRDTFGMVYLEALSSGMPIIGTRQFALKEIIKDGENGFFVNYANSILDKELFLYGKTRMMDNNVIDKEMVKELVDKIGKLLKNPKLLERMKKNSLKDFVGEGKFSTKKRAKALKQLLQDKH